jgi:hypothetical protein
MCSCRLGTGWNGTSQRYTGLDHRNPSFHPRHGLCFVQRRRQNSESRRVESDHHRRGGKSDSGFHRRSSPANSMVMDAIDAKPPGTCLLFSGCKAALGYRGERFIGFSFGSTIHAQDLNRVASRHLPVNSLQSRCFIPHQGWHFQDPWRSVEPRDACRR